MGFLVQDMEDPSGRLLLENEDTDRKFDRDSYYLVIAVGPLVNEKYDWAVVSDTSGIMLFILSRDPVTFVQYEQEVLDWVGENGFDKAFNKPIATYHGPDCVYDVPEAPVANLRS